MYVRRINCLLLDNMPLLCSWKCPAVFPVPVYRDHVSAPVMAHLLLSGLHGHWTDAHRLVHMSVA